MGTTTATVTMATILTTIGSLVTSFSAMVSTWVGVIFATGNEVIQLFVLLPLVGIGIGALKRLMSC